MQQVITLFVPGEHIVSQKDVGLAQLKATYIDDIVMRMLFHVTVLQVRYFEPQVETFEWMSREQIAAIDHPSARILLGLIEYAGTAENGAATPVIVG